MREGGVVMIHASMSALGWVVGGEDTVVLALLDVLGPRGTLAAYAGWDENPYHLAAWPEEWRRAYESELPPYDPAISVADHELGRVPERIRTWPGAVRGEHPEANLVAVGPRAAWLVSPHHFEEAYREGTPLARLVEARGQVLMLGAPLGTITLLASRRGARPGAAQAASDLPDAHRPRRRYCLGRATRHRHVVDWCLPYEDVIPPEADSFEFIAREALNAGIGITGRVGESTSHLFDASNLVRFAVRWIEDRFT